MVLENGQEVLKKTIEVNDPLSYKGLTFYQSSYGPAGDPSFTFRVRERATGETVEVEARQGRHIPLPGGRSFAVNQFTPNYDRFGPAAQIHVNAADGSHGTPFIVLKSFPEFDERRGGDYIFTLLDHQQRYYTGLQVAKDPGVEVVWLGCFLMVVGSLVAFFVSHRRLWVSIRHEGTTSQIRVAGSAHRNQPGFELYFEGLKQAVEKSLNA